jgi:hypothetical protein
VSRADELRAELEVEELQERLTAAKQDPKADPEQLQQLKVDLREARRRHRTLREATPPEAAAGDAVVRPATVKATTKVRRPGGGG